MTRIYVNVKTQSFYNKCSTIAIIIKYAAY